MFVVICFMIGMEILVLLLVGVGVFGGFGVLLRFFLIMFGEKLCCGCRFGV